VQPPCCLGAQTFKHADAKYPAFAFACCVFCALNSFGGGMLRCLVPKWLLFLNYCGECFFTACVFSFFLFLFLLESRS
jgi:hypothetical protein